MQWLELREKGHLEVVHDMLVIYFQRTKLFGTALVHSRSLGWLGDEYLWYVLRNNRQDSEDV